MNWKLKATVQNIIDVLPSFLAYPVYEKVQRTLGALSTFRVVDPLAVCSFIVKSLKENGGDIVGKTVLEVGTGSRLDIPIGLWLSGASRIITVDLNPFLKKDLVRRHIDYIRNNRELVEESCPAVIDHAQVRSRYELLMRADKDLNELMNLMNIEYLAPVDAARLSQISDCSVDVHFSTHVLEHIPPSTIENIFREARRVLKKNGLIIHNVDLGDHCAYDDQTVTFVNFLQFTEKVWGRWAGNRFMYHNRMRVFEYDTLFRKMCLEILSKEVVSDEASLALLKNGFKVDARFAFGTPEELSIKSLNITGRFI